MTIRISYLNGSYSVKTPYSPSFVDKLKASVPAHARKWSAPDKTWIVGTQYGEAIKDCILKSFGDMVDLPATDTFKGKCRRQFEMRYLGMIKDREDFSRTAYGFADGDWQLAFPEDVLKLYFKNDPAKKSQAQTLYEVLTIDAKATADEIKSAYRRLAKLTHPDVNKEPDAADRFRQVQHAYESLTDTTKRAKYDAGLRLMQSASGKYGQAMAPRRTYNEFQPPIRCGKVDVTGEWSVGRLVVESIHSWTDITDYRGWVLVTSWPRDAKNFTEQWVDPKFY